MGPCHAGGPPARPKHVHSSTARARTPPHHGGRPAGGDRRRPAGTAEIDRGEGHGRASGCLPSGMAGRRRIDDGRSEERGRADGDRTERGRSGRREDGADGVRVAAAAWRKAATARNGGDEQRRRRRKILAESPLYFTLLRARRCARGGEGAEVIGEGSSVPGRGIARDQ